jgi:hypothetical protein
MLHTDEAKIRQYLTNVSFTLFLCLGTTQVMVTVVQVLRMYTVAYFVYTDYRI